MYSYMGHHLSGKIPSRNEFMRRSCEASTVRRDQVHPLHTEAMPCREGAALFSPPAHAPAVHHNTLSPEWGGSCWLCHCRTKEELGNKQELSAGGADHHMVNPAEHLQENTIICVCSSHISIFQTSRSTKTVIFLKQQYFSHCYFYFHQWTIGNGGVSCQRQ